MTDAQPLAGQLDGDEALELVVRDERAPAPAAASVRGELVAPAADLIERFTAILVARPQTQRTYAPRARASCAGWGGSPCPRA